MTPDAAPPAGLTIRPLAGLAELRACVELQEATWGPGFAERAPSTILMLAQRLGGVVSGAFEGGGALVGFVFGLTGLEGGRPVHWSDMLAVRGDWRDRGVGEALKRHQREVLLAGGVDTVLWTFDPLESRNARLNLTRLAATAREYARDFYGESDSPLHRGLGTDRLLVRWALDTSRVRDRLAGRVRGPVAAEVVALPAVLDAGGAEGLPEPAETIVRPAGAAVTIAVPAAIQAVKAADPELARVWRARTRAAFEACFAAGYEAVELVRTGAVGRYVLEPAATG